MERGALVLHGFTATAREVSPLADHLAASRFDVECPTLPGHGTHPADLQKTTWHDWYAGAEASFEALTRRCERVAVCGLSMGGLLALRMAALRRDVRAVVSLATPATLPLLSRVGVRLVAPFIPYFPKPTVDLCDAVERAAHVGYKRFPMRATRSLMDLMIEVRRCASQVRVPVLIVHSKRDHTVPMSAARWLGKTLPNARTVIVERSFHVLTRDVEREEIAHAVRTFLEEVM